MRTKNAGYDDKIFMVSREQKHIALLPGVGKFCKCGCSKRIEGKVVTRKVGNKTIKYYRKPQENKEFFSVNCKVKYHQRNQPRKSKSTLNCMINLLVHQDKQPYRVLTLYLGLTREKFRITPDYKELWNMLEKLSRYSYIPDHKKIVQVVPQ